MPKWWSSPGDRGPLDIRMPHGYCPHDPSKNKKQYAALVPQWIFEILYGGAAGGGKSDWLLMSALQYVDIPGYAALILRRSFQDLIKPGAIMARSKEWLEASDAVWNENNHEWTFPRGAKLTFGYLKAEDDVYQYQSAEYQYIGFDELTQFSEFQYNYMRSRIRRPADIDGTNPLAHVPLRMRAASNPGGRGHQWVRRRFVDVKVPDRLFLPAGLADNPFIDQESYITALSGLDEHTQAQLLRGDWTARPPGPWAFNHHHLDAAIELGRKLDRLRAFRQLPEPVGGVLHTGNDYGEAAHSLIGWPMERGGMYLCAEHPYEHGEPDREAYKVMEQADAIGWPIDRMRFDAAKPESARLMRRTFKRERGEAYGRPSKISFAKWKRAAILHSRRMLRLADRAFRADLENSDKVVMGYVAISPKLEVFIEQAYNLQFKGEDTEDLVKQEDHGPDAFFSLIAPLTKGFKSEEEREAVTA